jgi:hypothetical protein
MYSSRPDFVNQNGVEYNRHCCQEEIDVMLIDEDLEVDKEKSDQYSNLLGRTFFYRRQFNRTKMLDDWRENHGFRNPHSNEFYQKQNEERIAYLEAEAELFRNRNLELKNNILKTIERTVKLRSILKEPQAQLIDKFEK